MTYLLGVDVGTTGCKAQLFNLDGTLVSQSYREYPLIYPKVRWVEENPEEGWWKAFCDTVKEAVDRSKVKPKDIAGVSVSCTNAIIAVDKEGKPLRNAIMQLDKRMVTQAEWIRKEIGEEEVFKITGNRVSAGGTAAPTMLWMKENEPKLFEKTHKFLYPTGYIVLKLTGKFTMDWSRASFTILFETGGKRKWSEKLCEEMGIPIDKLPETYPSWEVVGEVTTMAAEKTGLAKGTPVVAGMADTPAAALGTRTARPRDFFYVIGTVGRPSIVLDNPDKFDMRMVNVCHAVPDCWLALGVQEGCGASIRWFRDTLGLPEMELSKHLGKSSYELMDIEAERASPGSGGLIYLPYIAGERHSPVWDPNVRAVLFGLTVSHTRGDVIRAFMEGVAFAIRHNLEVIEEEIGIEVRSILLSGGGSRSSLWRQIIADITGKPVLTCNITDSEPIGNAVVVGYGVKIFKDVAEAAYSLVKIANETKPREEYHERYESIFKVYKRLYEHLKKDFEEISKVALTYF